MSKLIITLDSSQMKAFMECEQLWCLAYVENLQFHLNRTIYLDKGTFVHKLLEVFYILRALNPKEDRFVIQKTVIDVWKKGKQISYGPLTLEKSVTKGSKSIKPPSLLIKNRYNYDEWLMH